MGSSRGPGYSTRGPRQRNRNRSTPYKKNKYTTSGDSSKAWKHDFYGKEDEEIEETGWRKKEKKEDDLLDGTSVIIDNLHWEITEAELKVYMFYLQSFYSIRRRSNDHLLFFYFFFIFLLFFGRLFLSLKLVLLNRLKSIMIELEDLKEKERLFLINIQMHKLLYL